MLDFDSKKRDPSLPVETQSLIMVGLRYLEEENSNKKIMTVYKISEIKIIEMKLITALFE